ncbi:MAG: hypothetical protein Q9221_006813 [Calogaya cf. arnoldii]
MCVHEELDEHHYEAEDRDTGEVTVQEGGIPKDIRLKRAKHAVGPHGLSVYGWAHPFGNKIPTVKDLLGQSLTYEPVIPYPRTVHPGADGAFINPFWPTAKPVIPDPLRLSQSLQAPPAHQALPPNNPSRWNNSYGKQMTPG